MVNCQHPRPDVGSIMSWQYHQGFLRLASSQIPLAGRQTTSSCTKLCYLRSPSAEHRGLIHTPVRDINILLLLGLLTPSSVLQGAQRHDKYFDLLCGDATRLFGMDSGGIGDKLSIRLQYLIIGARCYNRMESANLLSRVWLVLLVTRVFITYPTVSNSLNSLWCTLM